MNLQVTGRKSFLFLRQLKIASLANPLVFVYCTKIISKYVVVNISGYQFVFGPQLGEVSQVLVISTVFLNYLIA